MCYYMLGENTLCMRKRGFRRVSAQRWRAKKNIERWSRKQIRSLQLFHASTITHSL
jgi:hypothetical protein